MFFPLHAWVFSGHSDFLPHFKNMLHRLIADCKLYLDVNVSLCGCMSLCGALQRTNKLSGCHSLLSDFSWVISSSPVTLNRIKQEWKTDGWLLKLVLPVACHIVWVNLNLGTKSENWWKVLSNTAPNTTVTLALATHNSSNHFQLKVYVKMNISTFQAAIFKTKFLRQFLGVTLVLS